MSNFENMMEQIKAEGSRNQEIIKSAIVRNYGDDPEWDICIYFGFGQICLVTAEQFLAIYKILGE